MKKFLIIPIMFIIFLTNINIAHADVVCEYKDELGGHYATVRLINGGIQCEAYERGNVVVEGCVRASSRLSTYGEEYKKIIENGNECPEKVLLYTPNIGPKQLYIGSGEVLGNLIIELKKVDTDNNDDFQEILLEESIEQKIKKFEKELDSAIAHINEFLDKYDSVNKFMNLTTDEFETQKKLIDSEHTLLFKEYEELKDKGVSEELKDKFLKQYQPKALEANKLNPDSFKQPEEKPETKPETNFSGKLIDDKTQEIIDWVLNLIRIVGIILMIILGMLDFIKAAASGNEEQVNKSKTSFIKRLIACVILFLLPFIVDLLIWIVNTANGSNVIESVSNQ